MTIRKSKKIRQLDPVVAVADMTLVAAVNEVALVSAVGEMALVAAVDGVVPGC